MRPWCGPSWCSTLQNSIPALLNVAFIFLLLGYGTKVGLAPLHAWLPDAHAEGPTPISAVLSGLLLNVALYALLRFKMLLALNPAAIAPGPLMVILGLISCLFAAFMLYRRRDIKRMFAYSSIEHMGIIVFAFGMGGALANFAGLLHMTMHSLTKSAIFFAVGHIAQVKGTQKIADMGGLTVTNPVLGWGLVLGVVAIAGLPPLGIFMSEFLVVSSTFAREPWLAVILALGILVALGGLFLRLEYDCFWRSARANRESRSVLRADVHASGAGIYGWHLYAAGAGQGLRECRETIGIAMTLLSGITHTEVAERHHPWPRAVVAEDGWQQAIDQLATGQCSLFGLWGDAPEVHMALLDEESSDVAVISYTCKSGKYPSVAARHPPAIRLERAIRDLFGLDAVDALDARPWLDLGFWSVRHPLGKKGPAREPVPYKFLPAEGEGLHQIPVGPVHAGIIEPGHFRFTANGEHVVRLEQRLGWVHKGIESLMRGATLEEAAKLASRTSGDSTVAYAFAFAQAAEAAMQVKVPLRASLSPWADG